MNRQLLAFALAGSSALAITASAAAQNSSIASQAGTDSSIVLEEIVVTATKRLERLQDVPFAISAVTADTLTRQGEVKLADISARVPGLQISDQSVTSKQSSIVIRGLSGAGNGNPTAAIYLDDAPLNASTYFGNGVGVPDLDPGDLARIEVLKGPQGTLYGATSLGGLVKYITRAPDYDEYSARVEASATSVKDGEWGYALRGRINAPLADNAAITASGFRRWDAGYIDDPSRSRSNINGGDQYGGRLALGMAPAEDIQVTVAAIHQRQKTDGSGTIYLNLATGLPIGGDLEQNIIPGAGGSDARSTIVTGVAKIDFDDFSVTSASSYISRRFNFASDLSNLLGPSLPAGTGGLYRSETRNEKATQELRVSSSSGTDFVGWQAGLFYTSEDNEIHQNIDLVLPATGASIAGQPVITKIDLPSDYKEIAGSGTVTLRFTPEFDVEGGARYSHNKQDSIQTVQRGTTISAIPGDSSEGKTTFSLNARYRPTRDLTLYSRIASGFRPGGPNVGQSGDKATYGSDSVISYEAGAKGATLDGLLTFDLSAFYIDWSDIQLQGNDPVTGIQYFSNAGKARSKGLEGAIVLTPVEGLSIDANLAYTDAYLIDPFTLVGTYALAHSPLPFSPKWAWHAGAEYGFDLDADWRARAGAAFRHVGKRASFYETTAAIPRVMLPSYDSVDFTLGVEKETVEVNLFLRNAFDKRAIVSTGQAFRAIRLAAVNQPRTFGISVTGKF